MTWRELSVERLYELRDHLLIDVRSPCEHIAESIPGAVNIPLLSDNERAQIGTIYKNDGEIVARRQALKIISPKIPQIVDDILGLTRSGQALVIHCWRGGLRSEAVASFLAIVGFNCFRLTGGYKAWRRHVVNYFSTRENLRAVVLHGQTGAGKSEILKRLARRGAAVLDLESLANHRGSVFGGLGLPPQPSQKNFEAAVWQNIRTVSDQPVFMEGEGRKIGKVNLPVIIYSSIGSACRVLVSCSIESRVERLIAEYSAGLSERERSVVFECLAALKGRLPARRVSEISEQVAAGNLAEAVGALLLEYYDPLYDRQLAALEPFDLTVSGEDPEQAACDLIAWAEKKFVYARV